MFGKCIDFMGNEKSKPLVPNFKIIHSIVITSAGASPFESYPI